MARLKTGILDGGSGKVGNVVMYTRYGQDFIRVIPRHFVDKQTPARLAQRQKMALVHEFLRPAKEVIKKTFANDAITRSPYQAAQSYSLKHAITGVYPNQQIDIHKALISKGEIPLPQEISFKVSEHGLEIYWNTDCDNEKASCNDSLYIMWSYKNNQIEKRVMNVTRSEGYCKWDYFTEENIKEHSIWVVFRNQEESDFSDSYLLQAFIPDDLE